MRDEKMRHYMESIHTMKDWLSYTAAIMRYHNRRNMKAIDITELELLEYTNNRKKNTSGTEKAPSPVDYYTAPLNPENITSIQDFEIRLDSLKRASGGFGGF